MKLIEINLLPYRELKEQKQKKQFQSLMVLAGIIGVALCVLVYLGLTAMISDQNNRNGTLTTGIQALDKEIEEINRLTEIKNNFLQRKQKVEELDNKRFEGARIIDSVNQLVPDGAYLTELKGGDSNNGQLSKEYILIGKAISDNKVAMFMNALPSTGVFEQPELVGIEKSDDGQKFTLKSVLVENQIIRNNNEQSTLPASSPAPAAEASTVGGQ